MLPTRPLREAPKPKPPSPFVYLGIPQSVIDYRPKLPSRNMSIFYLSVASIVGLAYYDSKECKRIKQETLDMIKWIGEEKTNEEGKILLGNKFDKLQRSESPSFPTVQVLAAKVESDVTLDRSSRWFKRYVRPYLVAVGYDFEIIQGTTTGGLGRALLDRFRADRLAAAAAELGPSAATLVPAPNKPTVMLAMGRDALKEYLWALEAAYSTPLDVTEEARMMGLIGAGKAYGGQLDLTQRIERMEQVVIAELEKIDGLTEGPFAIVPKAEPTGSEEEDPASTATITGFSSFRIPPPAADYQPVIEDFSEPHKVLPPTTPPVQPPMILVPWFHRFGLITWLPKLYSYLNERDDVRRGSEAALGIILGSTRPIETPTTLSREEEISQFPLSKEDSEIVAPYNSLDKVNQIRLSEPQTTTLMAEDGTSNLTNSRDLDFMSETEFTAAFKKPERNLPNNVKFYRKEYNDSMREKVLRARDWEEKRSKSFGLGFGKSEDLGPQPKLESELRKERLDKELRWRNELEGWGIRRPGSGVFWNQEWADRLSIVDWRHIEESNARKWVQQQAEARKRAVEEAKEQWNNLESST